jgi:8-oxo-dGTP pyrophosphatase MutT (NUDIX family)
LTNAVQPAVPIAIPVQAGRPCLEELIPEGPFVGTSLILRQHGRFLYGMRPVRGAETPPVIELTGIGGGIEPTDKTFTLGVLREAEEEIGCGDGKGAGCRVNLIPCGRTLVVHGRHQLSWVTLRGPERPAALVFRHHRTPPRAPWHAQNQGQAWLIVYLADLEGRPCPTFELPWLLWMTPDQILQTAHEEVPLQALLAAGAELVLGGAGMPPEDSCLRLTDSQEALGLALGSALPAFYLSFRVAG